MLIVFLLCFQGNLVQKIKKCIAFSGFNQKFFYLIKSSVAEYVELDQSVNIYIIYIIYISYISYIYIYIYNTIYIYNICIFIYVCYYVIVQLCACVCLCLSLKMKSFSNSNEISKVPDFLHFRSCRNCMSTENLVAEMLLSYFVLVISQRYIKYNLVHSSKLLAFLFHVSVWVSFLADSNRWLY